MFDALWLTPSTMSLLYANMSRIYHWVTWAMPPVDRKCSKLNISHTAVINRHRSHSQSGKTQEAKRQRSICP